MKCRLSWYWGHRRLGILGLPDGRQLGPLSTGGLTLQLALTEREAGPPASNSHAWGCGLQDQYPDFHGETGATKGVLGGGWEAVGISPGGTLSSLPPSRPCPHAQVAAEVLEELCRHMGIMDPQEVQEFALFLIKREGELSSLGRKGG